MSYINVCKTTDIAEGQKKHFSVNGEEICVYHLSDGFFATTNNCTHSQGSLADGYIVDDHSIECPRHGAQFAIRSGTVMSLPAFVPIRTYNLKVEGETILIDVPDSPSS